MLCRFLLFLLHHPDDAEELTQETFRIALAKGPDPRKGTDYGAWLRSIARNLARNHIRKQRRRHLVLDDDIVQQAEARFVETGADQDALWQARREALGACIEKLSGDERALLRRRYEQGHGVGHMARELGIQPNTLSKRLERIRKKLAACIDHALQGQAVD
jgi:RNA polymerase sigma-70 factor (ECF subfamily)